MNLLRHVEVEEVVAKESIIRPVALKDEGVGLPVLEDVMNAIDEMTNREQTADAPDPVRLVRPDTALVQGQEMVIRGGKMRDAPETIEEETIGATIDHMSLQFVGRMKRMEGGMSAQRRQKEWIPRCKTNRREAARWEVPQRKI
ncbi:hypothetical protein FRC19_008260 [Serendipita sp. 401]|nr:hypothetical protein FRC19_008260 [Serendipita sp. 401]